MTLKPSARRMMIGDVAARLGVSVRTLRLYEAEGLISPGRTEAGQRVFSAQDLIRLRHVVALKKLGCKLDDIGRLLAQRSIDPAALLDLRIGWLQSQKAALDRTLRILAAARDRIRAGDCIDLGEFCDLVRLGEVAMTEEAWKQVLDHYYTPDEQPSRIALCPTWRRRKNPGRI